MTGRRIYLTSDDIDALRESLDYSIRSVRDWHAGPQGSPETADVGATKVEALTRLRRKLTAATERAPRG